MNIPSIVRVGSMYYQVRFSKTPLVENGLQCLGLCDYYSHTILLDATLSDMQTIETTFLHELVHALLAERGIHLEQMGLTYEQMEHVVDNIGIALHQLIMDNPVIFEPEEDEDEEPSNKKEKVEIGFAPPEETKRDKEPESEVEEEEE
jgi:hypothetical protein